MGIPLGWNIVRDEAPDKGVLRADLAGTRSPIRRRARGSRGARRPDALDASSLTPRFVSVLEPRLSHARTQLPPPAPPAPPVPELPALTPGFAPAGARLPSASPSASASASASASRTDRRIRPNHDSPPRPLPNVFTWTRLLRHDDGSLSSNANVDTVAGTIADTITDTSADTDNAPPPEIIAVADHIPPLRRVGHRTIADGSLPLSSLRESWPLDGLGDRERSNSVSSTASNLPWESFLATVVPDPVPPTAESSFASSAASASFAASSSRASSSNSNSTTSDHTHVTRPSRRPSQAPSRRRGDDSGESFARACESSDDGDSTASDSDDEALANPLSRRRMRPTHFADEPPSFRPYGRNGPGRGSGLWRYVNDYVMSSFSPPPTAHDTVHQLDGPVTEEHEQEAEADSFTTVVVDDDAAHNATPASPLDQELRDARNLLERLTRRGDVGDDFWASVGLTRSFADGVERAQERGRF